MSKAAWSVSMALKGDMHNSYSLQAKGGQAAQIKDQRVQKESEDCAEKAPGHMPALDPGSTYLKEDAVGIFLKRSQADIPVSCAIPQIRQRSPAAQPCKSI